MARLTILAGGSAANPFTLGHYILLNGLRNAKRADQIIWIPTGERNDKKLITSQHRETMTKLGIPNEWTLTSPQITIDFSDVHSDNTPTFLWLRKLQFQYPGAEIRWFTGVDSVAPRREYDGKCEIEARWIQGEELMKQPFLILPREGYPHPGSLLLPENFQVLDIQPSDISSTMVRELIKNGEPFEHLVPEKIAQYIKEHKLYGYQTNGKEMPGVSSFGETYSRTREQERYWL